MLRSWWHCYLWHILRTAPQPSWCHVNNSTPSGRHVNNSSTCWRSVSLQTKEHEKVIHGVSLWWAFIPSVMMRVLIKVTQQGFMILVQGKEAEPQCIKRGSARWEEDEAIEEETWATTWWAHTRRVRISSDSFYTQTAKSPLPLLFRHPEPVYLCFGFRCHFSCCPDWSTSSCSGATSCGSACCRGNHPRLCSHGGSRWCLLQCTKVVYLYYSSLDTCFCCVMTKLS